MIADDQCEAFRCERFEAGFGRRGAGHLVALGAEKRYQHFARILVVFDDEHPRALSRAHATPFVAELGGQGR